MTEIRSPFVKLRGIVQAPSVQPTGTPPDSVAGGYGQVPASRVNISAVPPAQRRLSPKEAEDMMRGELLGAVRELLAGATELTARLGGRHGSVNGVLLVRLVSLGAEGRWGYAGPVTVGSVLVENHHATLPIYVQSGDGATAPGVGTGTRIIAAGQERRMPIGAHAFTIWGPTDGNALVSVQAFTGLQAYGVTL